MIGNEVSLAKQIIRENTKRLFGVQRLDVICAKGSFSYNIYAERYCEVKWKKVTCMAFS
jgi:2-polyprenyl-3-methyl-5-hydroxy-6-metoxy-1,4-benzoquinol methylase